MQPLPDSPNANSTPTHPGQQTTESSPLEVFQPYKPPLRERKLAQTVVWVVVLLLGGIGFAAVTVWMFLPSMLPKLPLTFL
jgi:hypothetical protein